MTAPTDQAAFRRILSHFATGIMVATCRRRDGSPVGVTINSFTSVSLTPPLVLFCLGAQTRAHDAFIAAEWFSFNILTAAQENIARHFAGRDSGDWDGIAVARGDDQAPPTLAHSLGWLRCRRHTIHPGGDHAIIVGRVTEIGPSQEQDPLLYFGSRYRTLS